MSASYFGVDTSRIRWGSEGRIPAVVEDFRSGGVLMLGWVNQDALDATLQTGFAHFYSRSRNRLWMKGETSGNRLKVVEIRLDCDGDTLLYRVDPWGPACHTGMPSCFGLLPERFALGWLRDRIRDRRLAPAEESYTARLLASGLAEVARKVGEEAVELVVAAMAGRECPEGQDARVISETADLLYHLLVLLEARGISLTSVEQELRARAARPEEGRTPVLEREKESTVKTGEPEHSIAGPQGSEDLSVWSVLVPSSKKKKVVSHRLEFFADRITPLSAFERLSKGEGTGFLFESVVGGDQVGRYSFLGTEPKVLYRLYPDRLERWNGGEAHIDRGKALLRKLQEEMESFQAETDEVPFLGGFVGSFGFDLIRMIERLPHKPPDPWNLPVAILGRFDEIVVFDHAKQLLIVAANEIEGEVPGDEALRRLEGLVQKLARSEGFEAAPLRVPKGASSVPIVERFCGSDFEQAVEKAKEEIFAGEIFQVVLARRFSVETKATPLAIYRALRQINPSPYMVLLQFPEASLVGASPEALVQVHGRKVRTRPIAGTRRRGFSAEEDRALEAELLADSKERAEHLMLVDLGRNDLGRVAVPGTVRVERFQQVERYSHVMHLVSSVEAELAPDKTPLDALLAAFPAGTVSGAPKLRAIEILDRLEPESRGFYAGATGYLSFSGNLDTCITIRTLVLREGTFGREVSVTAGAGIVADSDPHRERKETENKAAALLSAVALAGGLEG